MRDVIVQGDCLDVLRTLEDNSIDALCTDPPSGISFMGQNWDHDKGGRQQWIAWLQEIMAEALRIVKPGGHALVWALPRTSHWTATALEDAGWEIRDVITHTFGSGFPKSLDVSKAIDRMAGAEREVLGVRQDIKGGPGTAIGSLQKAMKEHGARKYTEGLSHDNNVAQYGGVPITAPATPEAQQWAGFGSSLKPASEHWLLCRKPLAAANLASNVLAWGTGGLAIDRCRVETGGEARAAHHSTGRGHAMQGNVEESWPQPYQIGDAGKYTTTAGRWPPNFLLSHAPCCTPDACADSCPVRLLDEQAGERKSGGRSHQAGDLKFYKNTYRDGTGTNLSDYHLDASEGGPSRFFPVFSPDMPVAYFPKASRRERNAGCEGLPVTDKEARNFVAGLESGWIQDSRHPDGGYAVNPSPPQANNHPTVKPLALCRWLARLITPPGGTVLDCFAGSGSTLVACVQEGFHYLGIEQSAEYVEIAKARVAHAQREAAKPPKPVKPVKSRTPAPQPVPIPIAAHRTRKKVVEGPVQQLVLFA